MMREKFRFSSLKILLYLSAAIVLGLVASYVTIFAPESTTQASKAGVLDLTQVHVSNHPIQLQGDWSFYWQDLLNPDEIKQRASNGSFEERWIQIPGAWDGYRLGDQQLSSTGYATLKLMITLGEQDRNARLALRLPAIFHAYKLWVNGELLAEVGEVGSDKRHTTPQIATKMVFFQPELNQVELVIQVANFHHRFGGITKPIELGGSDVMTVRTKLKVATEMFITACLLIIGIYHLLLYMLRRKDKAPLYFGLFTLLFGIRSLLVGELLITQLWPSIPWGFQFKIEYLILCSGGPIIILYFNDLYPNYVSRWFHQGTRIITGIFFVIILLTPAIIFTQLLSAIGLFTTFYIIYLIVCLVHVAMQRMEGAFLFLLVSLVVLVTVFNDFLYYNEWSRVGNTSPLGLLIFTIAQMVLLSSKFTRAATNEERVTRELQEANGKLTEMNMNLEHIVQERTQALAAAHDDLRNSYDQLLLSEQGRKKLLAYITHDLRMPLSSMLGYVEAVQDKVKPERNEQYLRYIQESTIRINRMIEELSFLSHLETGQVSFHMQPFQIIPYLNHFFEQCELVVRDAGLDFTLDVREGEGAQSLVVEMDPQRLEQALFNLLSNAMKFTAKGGLVCIVLSVKEVNHDDYAIISVQDSGTGIPPEQLAHIFDRNYKYDRPGIEKGREGSGLGLAICREIVHAHGGTVQARSDGKTGSIFDVSLPLIRK